MSPRLWAKYAWLAHLLGVVFMAGISWAGITSQGARIDKLEDQSKNVPAALARIEQKVDDLRDSVNREVR